MSTAYGFNFSAIADDWWDACHIVKDNQMVNAIAETYRRTIHFDSIATIFCILLIVLPMLFKIYGFGIQTQLKSFYNKLYSGFNFYQVLLGLITEVIALLHLFVNQQPACVRWYRNQIQFNLGGLRSPNLDLAMMVLLAEALISYHTKFAILRIIIAITFVVLDAVTKILIGATNVSGAVETIALALWIIYFSKFVPPIVITSLSFLITLFLIIAICVSCSTFNQGIGFSTLKDSYFIALRGIFLAVISQVQYIHYAFSRSDFRWLSSNWTEEFRFRESDSDGGDAEIPRGMANTETKSVDFGKVLDRDLILGSICFICFLFGNWAIAVFPEPSGYSFFN